MPIPVEEVLRRGGEYFMGTSPVQKAAARISNKLDELGIPHAIVGGIAVGVHGHIRFTEDVDVLITREGLAKFKEHCIGLGWVNKFAGSKGVRDAEHNVKIDFLCTGEFCGDGKPGQLQFPDPAAAVDPALGEPRVIALPRLIELKLAAALTAPDRIKDAADVLELIRCNGLGAEFGLGLDASVRAMFADLWQRAQTPQREM
jgi:hypothetical protein